ncbi:hypothetical protein EDF39_2146 [Frondihabitans sp. PhB161]|nr:hypothetical protein EDF37_2102 [Frondihabitans sp. PhB153]RPF05443.1 hypothetical protein EDF39_2146 [Frondihabitans sp. PhB161]
MAGLFERLLGGSTAGPASPDGGRVAVGQPWEPIEVVGESYRRADIERFFSSLGRPAGGVTTSEAVLEAEPSNRFDKNAVKVVVDGYHLGYVPGDFAPRVAAALRQLSRGDIGVIPARVWGRPRDGQWSARVTIGHDLDPEIEKDYGTEDLERNRRFADEARRREAGAIKGDFWTIFKPEVMELKKQGRYDEALMRLYQMVSATERVALASAGSPDPWPTDQICMILTKQKLEVDQLRHLERFIKACGGHDIPDKIKARYAKARIARGE